MLTKAVWAVGFGACPRLCFGRGGAIGAGVGALVGGTVVNEDFGPAVGGAVDGMFTKPKDTRERLNSTFKLEKVVRGAAGGFAGGMIEAAIKKYLDENQDCGCGT